jgi:hypothetical protein
MSLDPDERLDALRREVLAERPASAPAEPDRTLPDAGTSSPTLPEPPALPEPPIIAPAPATPAPAALPPPGPPPPGPALERPAPPASPEGSSQGTVSRLLADIGDLDVHALLSDRSLSSWLGIGLLVVGGYLVLSWVVPGISVIGSLALLLAGVALLYLHLVRGAPPWALYAGAALAGMGAARILGDLLPGEWHGMTAIGVGVAFLAIGYLRHTQAGGYGWQGVVGGAAIALGLVQMVLGWLPGSPGLFDLLSPAVLLILGALLVVGTRWLGDRGRPSGDGVQGGR